ncbi:CNTP2 protein, partial [Polyodon spathula]|nr:CNTP2 protein [Polyodon spathula]
MLAGSYAAGYAKLNRRGGAGGWSPLDSDHYQWLQVDLGSRKQVTAIATQGRYSSSDWVTQYRLLYSDTGRNWKPYHQDGNIWAFTGNTNTESVVRHDLQHAFVARFLRIVPLDWNVEGQIGMRIELFGCPYWADVINFDGHGVISYRFRYKKMKTLKDVIALKFKTSESEGVIFQGEGQQGDYITLELKKAKLVLQLNLGSNQYDSIFGHTSVMTGSLLDDHHWHSVTIERYGRNINLTLDRHVQHFRTNGDFDHLDLDYEISFGGMPFSGKPSSSSRKNFKGCMESINYNGNNITDLARRKKLDTTSVGEEDSLSESTLQMDSPPGLLVLPTKEKHNSLMLLGDTAGEADGRTFLVTIRTVDIKGADVGLASTAEPNGSVPSEGPSLTNSGPSSVFSGGDQSAGHHLLLTIWVLPLPLFHQRQSLTQVPHSRWSPQLPQQGNLSFSCVETHAVPVFFNATSYLQLPGRANLNEMSVSFQFRTWNPSGLLVYSTFGEGLGMLEVDLNEGKVSAHINVTQTKKSRIDISSGSGLHDGQWHNVRFLAKENFAMLTIDGDEASAVRTNSPLHIKTGNKYYFGGNFLFFSTLSTFHCYITY